MFKLLNFYKKNKSLDRNSFVALKIGKLRNEKILDLGCRDAILSDYLDGTFDYTGVDFIPKIINNNKKIINLNLEEGINTELGNFDIITAIDVLEHIENIHQLYNQIFQRCNKIFAIALPNMGYYKFRLKFFFNGELSGKYIFHSYRHIDRHRWIPNYYTIRNFVKKNTPTNWEIKEYKFIAQRKRNHFFYYLEKVLSKIYPNLFVYEMIYIIRKL